MKLQQLIAGVVIAATVGVATPVTAAPIVCGEDVRFTFKVSSGAVETCLTGNGLLNSLPAPYASYLLMDSDPGVAMPSPEEGWFTVTGPMFTIDPSAWTGSSSMALLLQLPASSRTPAWALFILTSDVLGGSFVHTGSGRLASVSLYRGNPLSSVASERAPAPVPEPASLLLLGSGLLGLARIARARRPRG